MGAAPYEIEVGRLTALATNEELTPASRILAARKLLRFSEFSERSCRVGRKIAKLYLNNQDVSSAVRTKAMNLLTFTVEKKVDEAEEAAELKQAEAAKASVGPSLPADFDKPLFKDYQRVDANAPKAEHDALVAEAYANYDSSQPTYQKNEKGWLERTQYYEKAQAEFHAADRALEARYAIGLQEAANVSN
jgi:hypothetical protein